VTVRVYVAGPYRKPDPCANTRAAVDAADYLLSFRGLPFEIVPFVPHLSHLWHTMSPKPDQFWLDYDLHWLRHCDCVLRLPGESSGADKEEQVALGMALRIFGGKDAANWRESADRLIEHWTDYLTKELRR
jgi:hypothetical protein